MNLGKEYMVFFVLLLFYNFSVSSKLFPSWEKKKKPSNYNYDLRRKGDYMEKIHAFLNYLGVDFLPFELSLVNKHLIL